MKVNNIIIGAGISGIHIALQLLDKGEDFLMLEKGKEGMTKLLTIHQPTIQENILLEIGPSVFHSNQKELMKLISRLNLTNDISIVDPKSKAYYVYPGMSSDNAKKRWRELKKRVFDFNFNDSLITLEEASKKVLSKEEYSFFKWCWGEWYEVCDNNLMYLKKSLKEEGDYMIMNNGLDQIIKRGLDLLKDKVLFNRQVISIKKGYIIEDIQGDSYECNKLFICGNYKGVSNIETSSLPLIKEYLSLGKSKESLRFYAYFNRDIDIPYKFIFGKFMGKYTIKYSNRLWLIAYPDGILARKLHFNVSTNEILEDWIEMMNNQFKLNIKREDVEFNLCGYWEDAFSILNKEYYIRGKDIINKLKDEGIIITSLPKDNGENSAWMEGHLINLTL